MSARITVDATGLRTSVKLCENNCRGQSLYSITASQAAIIAPFRRINRYVGNLPPMPGV
jgi:hypothetical protein